MAKSITLAVAATATLLSGAAPASASEIQDAYYAHTRACLKLFFSDKAAHSAQCLPNNSPNIPAHAGSGGPVPVPPPVVVVPPPPPPVVQEPAEGGCEVVQTNCGPVCGYPDYAT